MTKLKDTKILELCDSYELEIIGNVYSNPELLKGGD